jgi:glycosyltransferase involved in cell wall biosynthesis
MIRAVCFLFIVGILIVCVLILRQPEGYDAPLWFEKIQEVFMKHLDRSIDPVHTHYYNIKTSNLSLERSRKMIQEDLVEYSGQVEEGRHHAEHSRIVIAGLIQNGAFQIKELIQRCNEIVTKFKDYRIVIVENNSTDGTREFLLEWSREDSKVLILCQDPFQTNNEECDLTNLFERMDPTDHSPQPSRIKRMAFLRNVYLEHIQHYYNDFDYLCVMDLDLKGSLFTDGFLHSIHLLNNKKTNMDAIMGNGMLLREKDEFFYYDSFAHVEENEPIMWENAADKAQHDTFVHMHITHRYSSQMVPDKVTSAFGGIALYKIASILKRRYNYSAEYLCCEHSFFHESMHVYVNPRFLFLIEKNGN